jgi:hypothetical protein
MKLPNTDDNGRLLTALILSDTVGNNQASNTTTNNDIVVLLGSSRAKDRRQEDSKELNSHSQTREDRHLETQSIKDLTKVN